MISVFPVRGYPKVDVGDEIAEMVLQARPEEGDVLVITQKIVPRRRVASPHRPRRPPGPPPCPVERV